MPILPSLIWLETARVLLCGIRLVKYIGTFEVGLFEA